MRPLPQKWMVPVRRSCASIVVGLALSFAASVLPLPGGVAPAAAQSSWGCTFDAQRENRPGGQWVPTGASYSMTGSDLFEVRRNALDACFADARRDGIDLTRPHAACMMRVCTENGAAKSGAPAYPPQPTKSVTGRTVAPGQEYCEHLGGDLVPTVSGPRVFVPNGRVYAQEADTQAQAKSFDACLKGEPRGAESCMFAGCKRAPASQTSNAGGGSSSTVPPGNLPQGNFEYYWRQVNGNWASKPTPTNVQGCPHPGTASCDAPFRKTYLAGEGTTHYLNGCNAPPIQIACTVQIAGWKPTPAKPSTPPQPKLKPFCQVYADKAILDNQRGRQANCPAFANSNVDWSANYAWCDKQTASGPVNAAEKQRQQLLASCLSGPTPGNPGLPTGRYPPGERLIERSGEWDVREHVAADGTFQRCSITMEKYKPVTWRVSLWNNNRSVLTVPAPSELPANTRNRFRYGVNSKWFDGEYVITPDRRSAIDITNTINEFSTPSTVDLPVGRSTYRVFFYSMPQAMNRLKACRARFR